MDKAIWVAIISALAMFVVAFIHHFLDRRREYRLKELQFRFDRYVDFLGAFAEIGSDYRTHEAHLKMANAINSMNLIASRDLLTGVYELLDYIQANKGPSYTLAKQDDIIRRIVLAIRHDLDQNTSELREFKFRTISPGTTPGDVVHR